jgi:uridine kinase
MDSVIIGVAGGTGSGKTTVAEKIVAGLESDQVCILGLDSYYREKDLPLDDRGHFNFDHPDAFDVPLLVEHLAKLRSGEAIECPIYDYVTHRRRPETVTVPPSKVIVLEGILVLFDIRLRSMMDMKIYVEVDPDVRFIRRLQRDVKERGRTVESVIDQYLSVVRQMHLSFVEPSKRYADIIIPKGGHNEIAITTIAARLRAILNGGPGALSSRATGEVAP